MFAIYGSICPRLRPSHLTQL